MTAQRRGVCALCGAAMLLRVFVLTVLDEPEMCNAGWLSTLMGGVIGAAALLPALLEGPSGQGGYATLRRSVCGRISAALLSVMMLYDAAASARLLSGLAAYAAMTDFPHIALYLPVLLVSFLFIVMGPGSLTGTAMIWRRVGAVLGVILLLVQLDDLNAAYLAPVLGPGVALLTSGASRAGGLFAAMTLAGYILCGARAHKKFHLGSMYLFSVLVSAAATAIFAMLVPSMPGGPITRLFRMEALMDNGLSGLSMELFYVLLLEGSLVLISAFESLSAAACLSLCLPGAAADASPRRRILCALMVTLAEAALIAAERAGRAPMLHLLSLYYPLALIAVFLACIAVLTARWSDSPASPPEGSVPK